MFVEEEEEKDHDTGADADADAGASCSVIDWLSDVSLVVLVMLLASSASDSKIGALVSEDTS